MALHITDDEITSDEVPDRAYLDDGMWYVADHPGRPFDRNQAITAMLLAEEYAKPTANMNLIRSLESELR
jgi:hypothetical protein